ncbi:MAG: site-specific DNA-methyltransferase [Rhodoferax sp.]|uniref:DNA-methyltransferase n=1 Tax=Rhodoferax sp. TaxID=50421 RepID=UPI0017EFC43B|nr:site-specific DNA-methyltransferase [Rhodoferax sp.]NMM21547.1 site-specific DNA-methyltransferase [Rhodoferax sp.]
MENWLNQCHFGDCLETLRRMPDGIAQTCVTSPPYFGLRDYSGGAAEIGKEKTPDEFVSALVAVFREVRRVLCDDGSIWVNMGDSYGKGKQLLGIPWRLAFALQDDGWILRQEIIWHKPNPMPESVTDRCTKSHESIFLLAKSEKYYFDACAIKEQAVSDHAPGNNSHKGATAYAAEEGEHHRTKAGLVGYAQRVRSKRDSFKREDSKRAEVIPNQSFGTHREDRDESAWDLESRNKRSVWTVATTPYKGAHFATFPIALIEPCILAGAPAGGVVLDCFFGSGTTGQVAQNLGRKFIGCELNQTYKVLQDERLQQPSFEFSEVA